ncbi:hypothetical protein TNCV_1370541 [Trichonephila clavipes]|nr:hypothetical protein TNCV_1370541 [Trichonephila clavipes]
MDNHGNRCVPFIVHREEKAIWRIYSPLSVGEEKRGVKTNGPRNVSTAVLPQARSKIGEGINLRKAARQREDQPQEISELGYRNEHCGAAEPEIGKISDRDLNFFQRKAADPKDVYPFTFGCVQYTLFFPFEHHVDSCSSETYARGNIGTPRRAHLMHVKE